MYAYCCPVPFPGRPAFQQEDGWVVCRVFKKKNHNRSAGGFQTEAAGQEEEEEYNYLRSSHVHHVHNVRGGSGANSGCGPIMLEPKQNVQAATQLYEYNFDGSMHLPQLLSPAESAVAVPPPSFISPLLSLNNMDIECSQNLLRLTSTHHHGGCGLINNIQLEMRMNNNNNINGDWSFLDKLLQASHNHNQDHHSQTKCHHPSSSQGVNHVGTSAVEKFPFQYLGCETEILKFSK